MARNVGASFTLSVLTVLVFAVLLYQPDPSPPPQTARSGPQDQAASSAAPSTVADATPEIIEARDPDAVVPPVRPTVVATSATRPSSSFDGLSGGPFTDVPKPKRPVKVVETARATPAPEPAVRPAYTPLPLSRVASTRPTPATQPVNPAPKRVAASQPREPRGSFTQVRRGETLSAVAIRVYGNEDDRSTLFKANRDAIAVEDAPLREGTLLRTP